MGIALKQILFEESQAAATSVRARPLASGSVIMLADLVSLTLAIAISVVLRDVFQGAYQLQGSYHMSTYWRLWPVLGLFFSIYGLFGLYPGVMVGVVDELRRTAAATTAVFLVLAALTFVLRVGPIYSRLVFVAAWLISLALIPLARSFVRHRFARRPWWGYPALVLGAGETGRMLVATLEKEPELGLRAVAVLDEEVPPGPNLCGVPLIQGLDNAPLIAREVGISHVIVAMPHASRAQLLGLLESHASTFPHVLIIPDLDGVSSLGIKARDLCRLLTLEVRKSLLLPGPRLAKRIIDITVSLALGIALLPLLALIVLLIKLESHGPALYAQKRIGRRERTFRVWKFRSMVPDADRVLRDYLAAHPELAEEWQRDHKLRNDPRVTRVGRLLRKTSLDELPQLWNVLCGQMSLVGPRPIVYEEIPRYGEAFSLYAQVLPGLTGLWQVSGRNDTTYTERIALDAYYVRNWSPWLDIYLLARTFSVVIAARGAY